MLTGIVSEYGFVGKKKKFSVYVLSSKRKIYQSTVVLLA